MTPVSSEVWTYDGNQKTSTYGDVQRCSNGNTFIDYSFMGIIHEVAPDGTPLRTIAADLLGYIDWRPSLYGPPERW